MARLGAGIAAGAMLSLLLGGCGSTGSGNSSSMGGLFSSSPLDLFHQSAKVTKGGTAGTGPLVDTEYDCPEVKVRYGAATLMIGTKPGEGEPAALDVKYQGSILRTARECHLAGNIMTMKVGIEGRIITGPAGTPGNVDVPLRIAVVQESGVSNPKAIVSKFERQTVTIAGAIGRATFTLIDPEIAFPLPKPVTDITQYVVYVGFDPVGAQPPKRKPVRKHPPRRHLRPKVPPRSS
jgi:hypothetical protein